MAIVFWELMSLQSVKGEQHKVGRLVTGWREELGIERNIERYHWEPPLPRSGKSMRPALFSSEDPTARDRWCDAANSMLITK